MVSYDVALIGTSPLSIIEACYLKNISGKYVVNIDEREFIGGAWTTVKYDGFPEIESGCHIWSYERSTYQLLAELFGIKMTALTPQPTIAYKGWLIPYDYKANVLSAQRLIKGVKHIRKVIKAPDVRFALFPSKYLYPPKGAFDLKNSLSRLVRQNNLNIKLTTVVDTVKVEQDGVRLYGEDGSSLMKVKELVLTSLSSIRSFTFEDNQVVKPTTREAEYIHVHFVLTNVKGRAFSYIRTNGDAIIHRLSDMTNQVEEKLNPNEKLFCAGIFAEAFHKLNLEEIKDYLLTYMKKYKLIASETEIIKIASNIYPSYYNKLEEIKEIERKGQGKIRFLRSTDFVYSFYNQRERYKALLSSNAN